ncbi:hypothetical protein B9Z65_8540 [Elsinoe australis]|uniref:Uncharacterized protein n=1 Tax=Elsinoe australis TaxID=40998 RepID=A0A2P7YE29_9PEZI|nr:hypothetical protein B9Z65_8540 [Elsinoe australis]
MKNAHGCYPVTALACSGAWLLAGEGPFLRIYSRTSITLKQSVAVFSETSIHGISLDTVDTNRILIWGGFYVAVLRVQGLSSESGALTIQFLVCPTKCADWILDGQFSHIVTDHPDKNETYGAALVTAHNALLLLQIDSSSWAVTVKVATSQSKSILYCARLSWEAPDRILIAAGTVFGQLLVWSASLKSSGVDAKLHKVFTGHEGSPFGLCISTSRTSKPSSNSLRLLGSCSDDRSIRLWDISDLSVLDVDPQAAADQASTSDVNTGFLSASTSSGHSKELVAQAMGHLSRIWGVEFLVDRVDSTSFELVTFGEDATCQYWRLEPTYDDQKGICTGVLENQGYQDRHAGKHIWSHALSNTSDGVFIATGGADGAITIQKQLAMGSSIAASTLAAGTGDHSTADQVLVPGKIRSYSFVTTDIILMASNEGEVYLAHLPLSVSSSSTFEASGLSWQHICHEADFAGFSMTASVTSLSLVFLAGKSGSLFAYSPRSGFCKLLDGKRKAAGVFARRSPEHKNRSPTAVCLLARLGDPVAVLIEIPPEDHSNARHARLTVPDGEVISTFAILPGLTDAQQIAIGFRSGRIALYEPILNTNLESTTPSPPILNQQIHSDAITDIATTLEANTPYHIFTCRDGSYSIHTLALTGLIKQHHLSIPLMTEASQILSSPTAGLLIAGFHRKSFTLWSASTEQHLFSISCGGSNRSWTYCPNHSDPGRGGTLAWTQASSLLLRTEAPDLTVVRINSGSHGREIKAVAVSPVDSAVGRLVATGAEDTDVKLHRVTDPRAGGGVALQCARTLRRHNTGVQCLAWSGDGEYLVSSGGCEELFVWRVRVLAEGEVGVVCEGVCPFVSEGGDLRVMDLVAERHEGRGLRIVACRSDGSVCVYSYELEGKGWNWDWVGRYGAGCLMGINSLRGLGGNVYLTTGTDGHGAVLELTEREGGAEVKDVEWKGRCKIHQNAVHAAEVLEWSGDTHLLLSGGDDNALSISLLRGSGQSVGTLTIPRAHAAALTALQVIGADTEKGRVLVATAGLDQRIKLWEVRVDAALQGVEGVQVKRVENRYTPVADVASICSWREGKEVVVLVCGVGWDVWRVNVRDRESG